MKLIDTVNLHSVLVNHVRDNFSFDTSYKLYDLLGILENKCKFYDEKRKELLQKYGDKYSDGNLVIDSKGNVNMTEENLSAFDCEYKQLQAVEVENISVKFTRSELAPMRCSIIELGVLINIIQGE